MLSINVKDILYRPIRTKYSSIFLACLCQEIATRNLERFAKSRSMDSNSENTSIASASVIRSSSTWINSRRALATSTFSNSRCIDRSAISVCLTSFWASVIVVGESLIVDIASSRVYIFPAAARSPTMDAVMLRGSMFRLHRSRHNEQNECKSHQSLIFRYQAPCMSLAEKGAGPGAGGLRGPACA